MADDFVNARTHQSQTLCSSLRFKTYSDAKLAGLFLENDFPVVLFKKLFDVVVDPKFKADDITFHDIWDMFEYVAARRRKDATKRDAVVTPPNDTPALQQVTAAEHNVPPLVLDLVVDRLIEGRTPLGIAAMEPRWETTYDMNGADFRRMSLVHRSWTYIAQRGLRQRAVIPYDQISTFLLSPFCGPWITEMIIYWTVNNGDIGVTRSDIWCLEALLERTPNIRSLALVTSLVWPISHVNPTFDVDICLEIISELLPNLQNLWLKHCDDPTRRNGDRRLLVCGEIRSLFRYIPQMHSLKFLSLRAWGSRTLNEKRHALNWNDHPPHSLKTIELNLSGHFLKEDLDWLLKRRDEYQLESLSVCARDPRHHQTFVPSLRQSLQDCLQGMKGLQLCLINESSSPGVEDKYNSMYANLLGNKNDLVSLELFIMHERNIDLGSFLLPPSLERLAIHLCDERFLDSVPSFSFSRSQFIEDLKEHISRLGHLRALLITKSPKLPERADEKWDLDAFVHHMNDNVEQTGKDRIPGELLDLCKDRNIEIAFVDNAFPRQWQISQYSAIVCKSIFLDHVGAEKLTS